MQHYCKWLLALSLAALLAPAPLLAAEGSPLSGFVEIGGTGVDLKDDSARVNEYTKSREDDGATPYGKFDLGLHTEGGVVLEADADLMGARDQKGEASFDVKRVIRGDFSYNALEHQLDHDRLDYLDAAVVRGGMNKTTHLPVDISATGVTPDLVPAFVLVDNATNNVLYGSDTGNFNSLFAAGEALDGADVNDYTVVQTGGASLFGEDLVPGKNFKVTRREWKANTEVAIPALPNLTFDIGYRHEKREGWEQSIGMSKCASCHITGGAKEIDETTKDLKAGVTGRFGALTLRYEFTDRQFDNGANDPRYNYDPVIKPGQPIDNKTFDNRMIYDYDDGALANNTTPESEKQSHLIKARLDLPSDTTLVGSYVNSEVESSKTDEPGIFTIGDTRLTTTYDGYGLKATTRFGKKLKVNIRGKIEELESDDNTVEFEAITATSGAGITLPAGATGLYTSELESSITRDVLTAGIDASYRLARRTTLRLGYEHEEIDREDEHFGETETDTYKVRLNNRSFRTLSTRLSYKYEDIENPFQNPTAALVPVGDDILQAKFGIPGYVVAGDSDLYGTTFYDARVADLTNQPEEVHEAKLSSTWAPSPRFAATLTYRFKDEENDLNHSSWEQQTHAPGLSMWYAASQALNLTMSYNYFDQRSETAFCQGFYDG